MRDGSRGGRLGAACSSLFVVVLGAVAIAVVRAQSRGGSAMLTV